MIQSTKINRIEEAMQALGVTEHTLTEEESNSLDEKGFVVFTGMLDAENLEIIRFKYEELMEKEGMNAGKEVHQEEGTPIVRPRQ